MHPFLQDIRPIGGWSWEVHGHTFRGESLKEVLSLVRGYRAANLLPPGNPLEEFRAYAWPKWPYIFDTTKTIPAPRRMALTQSVHENLLKVKQTGGEPAKKEVIDRRHAICQECDFYQESLGPGPAREAVERLEILMGKKRDLGYCTLHGASLSIVLCKTNTSQPKRNSRKAPPDCPILAEASSPVKSGSTSIPSGSASSKPA